MNFGYDVNYLKYLTFVLYKYEKRWYNICWYFIRGANFMDMRLKEHIQPKRFIVMLAAVIVLSGVAVFFVADIFILPLSAFFALLLRFEPNKKPFSMAISVILVATSFFGGVGGVFSVCFGLCCGLLLWVMYRARLCKADTVFAITAFLCLYLFVALFLAIGSIQNDYSLSAALSYYEEFVAQQRINFINQMSEIVITDEAGKKHFLFNLQTAEEMFLSLVRLSISFFIITAFFLCGIICKIFTRVAAYAEKEDSYVLRWKFCPPSVVAYIYSALFVVSLFSAGGESIFAFTVINLQYVLMAVFGYLGLCHLLKVLKDARRKRTSIFIVFLMIFVLSISAIQILSLLGVYTTIVTNRQALKEQ